jgi:hypothetical protein
MERKILKLLLSREYFSKIRGIISDKDFSPIASDVLKYVDGFYEKDPDAEHVDHEVMIASLEMGLSPKFKDMAKQMVMDIMSEDISEANVAELVINLKKQKVGAELAVKLLDGNAGDIDKLINEYQDLEEKVNEFVHEETEFNSVPVAQAFEVLDERNRIPLYPRALNEQCKGGAIRGQNILIFARPEMGKTLFAINLIGGFLHSGLKVLYVGNEDPISAINPRIITRLSEMSYDQCAENPEEAEEKCFRRGYANLYLKEVYPGNWHEIRKTIERHEPDVVVVDQLRHLYCGNLSKVEQMERVAIEARNAAKRYGILCVGVTQAGDSAEGKAFLDQGDIDFSNTGMQGAMDLIIGIGADAAMQQRNHRMLSLCKNKISGIHSGIPVQYNIPINKVEGL